MATTKEFNLQYSKKVYETLQNQINDLSKQLNEMQTSIDELEVLTMDDIIRGLVRACQDTPILRRVLTKGR